jgi:hypothetical protein
VSTDHCSFALLFMALFYLALLAGLCRVVAARLF